MIIAVLLFLSSITILIFYYLLPNIEKSKPKVSKIKQKPKKTNKESDMLLRRLYVLGISKKSFQMWEYLFMGGTVVLEFAMNHNVIAACIYALVGRYLFRIILVLKASKLLNLMDSQTLQFVRTIADNLEIGESMTNAVTHAGLQLKEPLRVLVMNAINSSRADILLSDAIKGLSNELKTTVFEKLGRTIAKGINEGQAEIVFAIREIEHALKEGEKIAHKRADIIGGYMLMIIALFLLSLIVPLLEYLIKPSIWYALVNDVSWACIGGAVLNLYMSSSLNKYVRMYVERGEMI